MTCIFLRTERAENVLLKPSMETQRSEFPPPLSPSLSLSLSLSPPSLPSLFFADMGSSDARGVDAGDGVQEIVSLVNDHHVPPQLDAHGLARGRVQERVVRKDYQLRWWEEGVGVAVGVANRAG